jgi:hypothetical protein
VYSDKGELRGRRGAVRFVGASSNIEMQSISHVAVRAQRYAWVQLLIGDALVLLGMALGCFSFFTFDNPLTYPMLIVFNLLFFFVVRRKWVEVEYADELGQVKRVYFSDGSTFGWGGVSGGTKRIYELILASSRPAP